MAFLRCSDSHGNAEDYHLTSQKMLVGQDPTCGISIDDPSISSHHALVELKEGKWILHDLDSTNGTFSNGRRVASLRLINGQSFSLGTLSFVFIEQSIPQARANTAAGLSRILKSSQNSKLIVSITSSRLLPLFVCMFVFGLGFAFIAPSRGFIEYQIIPTLLLALASLPFIIRAGMWAMANRPIQTEVAIWTTLFTMILGITGLMILYWVIETAKIPASGNYRVLIVRQIQSFISWSLHAASDSSSGLLKQIIGMTIGVGLLEEFTKSVPALYFILSKGDKFKGSNLMTVGFFSGLGFGIGEALYSYGPWTGNVEISSLLLRWFHLIPSHAVWASIDAAILGLFAHKIRSFYLNKIEISIGYISLALIAMAVLHGIYNVTVTHFSLLGFILNGLSLVVFSLVMTGTRAGLAAESNGDFNESSRLQNFKPQYIWSACVVLATVVIFSQQSGPQPFSTQRGRFTKPTTTRGGFHEGQIVSWFHSVGDYDFYVTGRIEDLNSIGGMIKVTILDVDARPNGRNSPIQLNRLPYRVGGTSHVSLSFLQDNYNNDVSSQPNLIYEQ